MRNRVVIEQTVKNSIRKIPVGKDDFLDTDQRIKPFSADQGLNGNAAGQNGHQIIGEDIDIEGFILPTRTVDCVVPSIALKRVIRCVPVYEIVSGPCDRVFNDRAVSNRDVIGFGDRAEPAFFKMEGHGTGNSAGIERVDPPGIPDGHGGFIDERIGVVPRMIGHVRAVDGLQRCYVIEHIALRELRIAPRRPVIGHHRELLGILRPGQPCTEGMLQPQRMPGFMHQRIKPVSADGYVLSRGGVSIVRPHIAAEISLIRVIGPRAGVGLKRRQPCLTVRNLAHPGNFRKRDVGECLDHVDDIADRVFHGRCKRLEIRTLLCVRRVIGGNGGQKAIRYAGCRSPARPPFITGQQLLGVINPDRGRCHRAATARKNNQIHQRAGITVQGIGIVLTGRAAASARIVIGKARIGFRKGSGGTGHKKLPL